MASSINTFTGSKKLTKKNTLLMFPALLKISGQRFKRTWPLLSVIWLAMVVLVTLVCVEPLFARVTTFAQLQDLARATSGGPAFTPVAVTNHPTSAQISQVQTQLNSLLQGPIHSYVGAEGPVSLRTPDLQVISPTTTSTVPSGIKSGAASGGPQGATAGSNVLGITGYDPAQIAGDLKVIAGRLPGANSSQLEIAISEKTAHDLRLQVGSLAMVRYPVSAGSVIWPLKVVGIIQLQPAAGDFWHNGISNGETSSTSSDGTTLYDGTIEYNALAAQQALVPAAGKISGDDNFPGFTFIWQYAFNLKDLNADNIGAFLNNYSTVNNQLDTENIQASGVNSLWILQADFISSLYNFQRTITVLQIISLFLLCLTIALALLMMGTMLSVLVERQVTTIAAMRSRGAARAHIFWAFALQGTILVLLAMCVGPVLALFLVRLLTAHFLASVDQSAANLFAGAFGQVLLDVRGLVFVTVLLTFLIMLIAVYRSTKIDIVTLRRETARTTQVPSWRRLHLDIILCVLICLGYTVYIYTLSSPISGSNEVRLLQEAFSLLAVPLILIAVLLLFLRVMPLLFRQATRFIARVGSTSALLACAQMERAPRAVSRLMLLLVLTLSASFYLLGLAATQQQWYQDQADFQVGADFRGIIPPADANQSFAQLQHSYSSIHGVQAVTLGCSASSVTLGGNASLPLLSYNLVDADTYASTALWSSSYAPQSLEDLMQQLEAHRVDATSKDVVYALVDASMWNVLGLSPGATFNLQMPGYASGQSMHFVALAEVANIPGIETSPTMPGQGIGMLTDYQSYATVYTKDNAGQTVAPDTVWLRTAADAASLASVRHALPGFQDRRALLASARVQPDHANVMAILEIGVAVAFGLSLLGILIVSWVSIAGRRTNFAALRALGMAPRQIVAVLIWEQGIIYVLALLVGLGLGKLLSFNVVPVLTLISDEAYSSVTGTFVVPPTQPSFPMLLAICLVGGLLLITGLVVLLMARAASRPALDRALRLNED